MQSWITHTCRLFNTALAAAGVPNSHADIRELQRGGGFILCNKRFTLCCQAPAARVKPVPTLNITES